MPKDSLFTEVMENIEALPMTEEGKLEIHDLIKSLQAELVQKENLIRSLKASLNHYMNECKKLKNRVHYLTKLHLGNDHK